MPVGSKNDALTGAVAIAPGGSVDIRSAMSSRMVHRADGRLSQLMLDQRTRPIELGRADGMGHRRLAPVDRGTEPHSDASHYLASLELALCGPTGLWLHYVPSTTRAARVRQRRKA